MIKISRDWTQDLIELKTFHIKKNNPNHWDIQIIYQ
jgi:hypothetical protein